jgi:predicted nucleic acid-binding protein
LLSLLGSGKFAVSLSVPLLLEYEQVAKRLVGRIPLTETDIDGILDHVCQMAGHQRMFYLWRPFLKDPEDDMVLELAVAANCSHTVTFNTRDVAGADQFGIRIVTPREFLQLIGQLP